MMKIEFEALAGYEVSVSDYDNIIEPMYMATNLNKAEFVKVICKERFALKSREELIQEMKVNAVAAAVGKMEEAKVTEIDLTEAELEEITLTPEQEEELKKKLLFAINQDTETGQVEICPMNEKNCIILHGAEEMKWFINRLREAIQ